MLGKVYQEAQKWHWNRRVRLPIVNVALRELMYSSDIYHTSPIRKLAHSQYTGDSMPRVMRDGCIHPTIQLPIPNHIVFAVIQVITIQPHTDLSTTPASGFSTAFSPSTTTSLRSNSGIPASDSGGDAIGVHRGGGDAGTSTAWCPYHTGACSTAGSYASGCFVIAFTRRHTTIESTAEYTCTSLSSSEIPFRQTDGGGVLTLRSGLRGRRRRRTRATPRR